MSHGGMAEMHRDSIKLLNVYEWCWATSPQRRHRKRNWRSEKCECYDECADVQSYEAGQDFSLTLERFL